MSVHVLHQVFAHSRATLGARLVMFVLADSAHDDGVTWVYEETIAHKARLSERQVRRCLADLSDGDAPELEIRKAQRGRRRVNVYRVLVDGLDEIDYDRLPFTLVDQFTTGQIVRPSGADDRTSTTEKVSEMSGRQGGTPLVVNVREHKDPPNPPGLPKIDGRNVALDALCEVCAIDPSSPRVVQAATALNGKNGKQQGIAWLFWVECLRWCEANETSEPLERAHADPASFAEALAVRIRQKHAKLREAQPWRTDITPFVLAERWLDVELVSARAPSDGLTPEEVARLG